MTDLTVIRDEINRTPVSVEAIGAALKGHRFVYADERRLQDGIERALDGHGWHVQREFHLGAPGRIDFLVENIGIEVKVGGTPIALQRQVTRYLTDPRLSGIMVVTTRRRHAQVPEKINDKPVGLFIVGGVA